MVERVPDQGAGPCASRRVAIVVPALAEGGGVPAVAVFVHGVLQRSGCYSADLISIPVSSTDATSVRLGSPLSWCRGPQESSGHWQGIPYKHIGSQLAEIEVARYMPRARLTRLLNEYDLVQVIAGTPAVARVVSPVVRPQCLSVATTIRMDRGSALANSRGVRRLWRAGMTGANMLLERQVLSRVHHVFAQSAYTHRLLRNLVPEGRLSMGPPGVDTSFFHPGTRSNDAYLLSVARFSDPRKNVRMLFHAYARVRSELSDTPRLLLAGKTGPSREDWDIARQLGISRFVELREHPTAEELAKLYREATLFVLSSNEEGFGIVLVEAMASGTPVLSTCCGGPETVVEHGATGYLTPVGDDGVLAARLKELLTDEQTRRRMSVEARRVAEERFSLGATGRAYVDVYDRLLR